MKKFTQKDFLNRLEKLYKENVEISRRKNADYATDTDPFRNFRVCESIGIPAEVGILVRMTDKISRIRNLLGKKAQVKDETIFDTLSDLANYAMILRIYLEENGKI